MGLDDRPFCRIYVDHYGPVSEIERIVSEILATPVTQDGIVSDQLDVCVHWGDSYPPIEALDYKNFVNWKYSLEVVPVADGVDEREFAERLKPLLAGLREQGVGAVPACSFEDLLAPWNLVNA